MSSIRSVRSNSEVGESELDKDHIQSGVELATLLRCRVRFAGPVNVHQKSYGDFKEQIDFELKKFLTEDPQVAPLANPIAAAANTPRPSAAMGALCWIIARASRPWN